jgi:hypothetical protein
MTRRTFATVITMVCLSLIAQQLAYAQTFFSEGFESGNGSTFSQSAYGGIEGNPQYSVQGSTVASGRYALQHHFNVGQGGTYATYQFGDSPDVGQSQHYFDIYIQFKLRYSDGYDFSAGNNKIMIIGTQDSRRHDNVCCNPWVSHYITLYANAAGSDAYFNVEGNNKRASVGQWFGLSPNLNGTTQPSIRRNRWYTMEVHMRPNTDATGNGLFEMWIDGAQVTRRSDVLYRIPWNGSTGTDPMYGINFVMLSHYINTGAPRDQDMFYDDIILSRTYIGASGPVTDNTAPSAPENLRVQ